MPRAAPLTAGRARREQWLKRQRGHKPLSRWPVRCTCCDRRRTLSKHPDDYARPPRCHAGCRIRDERGRPIRYAPLRVDWWRIAREWHRRDLTCFHCGEYSFPHARGRGFCTHNHRMPVADRQERWESGRWA